MKSEIEGPAERPPIASHLNALPTLSIYAVVSELSVSYFIGYLLKTTRTASLHLQTLE